MNPRILVHGPPNRGKTRAIVETAPRPIYFVNAPGEKGHASIPTSDPDITIHPAFDPNEKPEKILKAVEAACLDAVKGGKYQTVALEGLHKLMEYMMDYVTGGDYFQGLKPDWSTYGLCYHRMNLFLDRLSVNNLFMLIVTAWSKDKPERRAVKGEKAEDILKVAEPDLLGEYSRKVIGEFGWVFHQSLKPMKDDKGMPVKDKEGRTLQTRVWQTRPHGTVKGVGMKGPAHIVDNFPLFIPADYSHLLDLWTQLDMKEHT